MQLSKFYIGLLEDEKGRFNAASLGVDLESVLRIEHASHVKPTEQSSEAVENDFEAAIDGFVRDMSGMHSAVPALISFMPMMQRAMIELSIRDRAKKLGKPVLVQSSVHVFEMEEHHFAKFSDAFRDLASIRSFAASTPGIFLIGLVSRFDDYIGKLVRAVLLSVPELIDASKASVTFAQLVKINSIDEAREQIIHKEVEAVLRDSHSEHFEWFEKKLSMPLRDGLICWPEFVEICERRNLWTHNGGIVSQQYFDVCAKHKVDVGGVKLGDRLSISADYLDHALNTFLEIGVKLGHTLWRKVRKDEINQADRSLNDVGIELLKATRYELAQEIFRFGVLQKKHSSELSRRMMVVNLANAHKLHGSQTEADSVLNAEDWSAVDDKFQICLAAIRGELPKVVALLKKIGPNGCVTAADYQGWPAFYSVRKNSDFRTAYEDVFGHAFEPEKSQIMAADLPEEANEGGAASASEST